MLYQRLAAVHVSEEADDLAEEIADRFGPFGEETRNLIEVMRFRGLLRRYGVIRAEYADSALTLSLSEKAPLDIDKILTLVKENSAYRFGKSLTLTVELDLTEPPDPVAIYKQTQSLLHAVSRNG